jgi:hypothetical protein
MKADWFHFILQSKVWRSNRRWRIEKVKQVKSASYNSVSLSKVIRHFGNGPLSLLFSRCIEKTGNGLASCFKGGCHLKKYPFPKFWFSVAALLHCIHSALQCCVAFVVHAICICLTFVASSISPLLDGGTSLVYPIVGACLLETLVSYGHDPCKFRLRVSFWN